MAESIIHRSSFGPGCAEINVFVLWTDTRPWSSLCCCWVMGCHDLIQCRRHFLDKRLLHILLTHFRGGMQAERCRLQRKVKRVTLGLDMLFCSETIDMDTETETWSQTRSDFTESEVKTPQVWVILTELECDCCVTFQFKSRGKPLHLKFNIHPSSIFTLFSLFASRGSLHAHIQLSLCLSPTLDRSPVHHRHTKKAFTPT